MYCLVSAIFELRAKVAAYVAPPHQPSAMFLSAQTWEAYLKVYRVLHSLKMIPVNGLASPLCSSRQKP